MSGRTPDASELTEFLQVERIALGAALVLVAEPIGDRWRIIGASSAGLAMHVDPVHLWVDLEGQVARPRPGRAPAAVCRVLGVRPGHQWLSRSGPRTTAVVAVYWTDPPIVTSKSLEAFRDRTLAAVFAAPHRMWGGEGADLLAHIADSLPVGLIYFEHEGGGVAANRFARNLLGLSSGELSAGAAASRLKGLGVSVEAGEDSSTSGEITIGGRYYAISSLLAEGAWGRGVVWRIEDVTEGRAVEAKFHDAKRALLLSQAAGGIGHEFNNLLSRVICLAEEIQEESDARLIHDWAETLIVTAERGADVVRRLMTCAGSPVTDVQTVDLRQAIESWRILAANDDVTVDVEGCSAIVLIDPMLLRASLDELLKNARQSGATRIAVACTREPGDLPVGLVVGDNGSGMDAPIVARATVPFFTTRAADAGVGLGLSMVQGALNQCGGKLRLVSQPGKGTIAKLLLPTPLASETADL